MARIYNTDSKGRKYVCEYGMCDYITEDDEPKRKELLTQDQLKRLSNLVITKTDLVQKTGGSFDV